MTSRESVLISVNDLPDAVNSGAQLLDVRWQLGEDPGAGYQAYLAGHLPSAKFLDLEAVLTGSHDDPQLGRHPLPSAERLAAGLGALGIDPSREIVVYDQPGTYAATRAWWVLTWAGLSVRVLDGGIKAWQDAAGGLVAGEPPAATPTSFSLTTGHLPTLDANQVAAFDGLLIDVRAPERFTGQNETVDPVGGHIPGAINRPVAELWNPDGTLPDANTLLERLALPADTAGLVVYCGSGVSATQTMLALTTLGIDAAMYPPSWSGWSADPNRPVAVG